MNLTAVAATKPVREMTDVATAYRLVWLAVIFDFLAFGVGFEWDKRWHATHAFEDFFSPPHLFIYTMHLCASSATARLPRLRYPQSRQP